MELGPRSAVTSWGGEARAVAGQASELILVRSLANAKLVPGPKLALGPDPELVLVVGP